MCIGDMTDSCICNAKKDRHTEMYSYALIHSCDMTHLYVAHDICECSTRFITNARKIQNKKRYAKIDKKNWVFTNAHASGSSKCLKHVPPQRIKLEKLWCTQIHSQKWNSPRMRGPAIATSVCNTSRWPSSIAASIAVVYVYTNTNMFVYIDSSNVYKKPTNMCTYRVISCLQNTHTKHMRHITLCGFLSKSR